MTVIVLAFALSFTSKAQEVALPKGSSVVSAGLGFVNSFSNIAVPPIYAQFEYMVAEFGGKWGVGVGALGGYFAQKAGSSTFNCGAIDALGDIHFSPMSKLDIYAGLTVGFITASVDNSRVNGTHWSPLIGARYFFSDTFGLNLQIGGLGTLNLGVSFRF